MPNYTFKDLEAITGAEVNDSADVLAIYDDSANTTKKISRTELVTDLPPFPDLSITGNFSVNGTVTFSGLTPSQVMFTNGSSQVTTKAPVDARTALQTTTYTYTQGVSANPWVINHNLNAFPTVWVIDPLNRAGWAEVEYVDSNTCKVHFPGEQTGTAYLNF